MEYNTCVLLISRTLHSDDSQVMLCKVMLIPETEAVRRSLLLEFR